MPINKKFINYIIFIFLLIIFFMIVIAVCTDPTKNKQSDFDEVGDTLSANIENTFLFLTEWFDKVGVYKYDLAKKKYTPVWWHPRENVVMLVYKSANHPAFFLTAEKISTKGSLPSFSRLKLFIISHDQLLTQQIDDIGSGIQFTARWNDDENLEVVFTEVDKTVASYVNQYTKVYDHYGKLIDSSIKTFDILKSGFPQIMPPRIYTISPSGKYGVSSKDGSLFLKTVGSDLLKFITKTKHPLNRLKWSEDEKYLFISTLDLDNETIKSRNPETSELSIYSIAGDSLLENFSGAGVKNFLLIGNLFVFDDGFDSNSVINIYDLNQNKIIDTIKPRSGCGLQIMPGLSDK